MTLPPYDGPLQRPRQAESTALAPDEPEAGGAAASAHAREAPPRPPEPAAGAVPQPAAPRSVQPPFSGEIEPLNLARRPFVNTRPVARVAAILWLLGLALLGANLALFMGYLTKSQATRAKLAEGERETDREKLNVSKLQGMIGTLGLDQQNREVAFLNRKIDERTFSWSLLFDRMAQVLPQRVRLLRLRPSNVVQKDAGDALLRPVGRDKPAPVSLAMSCEAKDDEAVLRFVDNLFAHPAFAEPNLEREDRDESGLVHFNVSVQYQPDLPAPATQPAEAEARPASRRARGAERGAAARTAAPEAGGGAGSLGASGAAAGTGAPTAAGSAASGAATSAAAAPSSPAGAGLVRVGPAPEPAARPGAPRRPPATRPRPTPRPILGGARAGRAATPPVGAPP